jgi:type I restriction enzyme, R subunit
LTSRRDAAEIQRVFEELARLNDALNIEDQQYIAEGFESEDQRAIYQLLCKEKTDLTPGDIKRIKAVAKELLEKPLSARNQLQYLRDRAALQAQMKTEIFDYLFDQLPEGAYGQEEILGKSQRVFEHFYRRQIDGQTVH